MDIYYRDYKRMDICPHKISVFALTNLGDGPMVTTLGELMLLGDELVQIIPRPSRAIIGNRR